MFVANVGIAAMLPVIEKMWKWKQLSSIFGIPLGVAIATYFKPSENGQAVANLLDGY